MTLSDVFWITVAIVVVVALLFVIDWHRVNRREAARDDHVYQDRRAEIRAQLQKLTDAQPPNGHLEESRRRMAQGKTPAVKGIDDQRLRRRSS